MKQYQFNNIAKKIIKSNIYLTLATVDKNGKPWASPVRYHLDSKFNFYFISQTTSVHIKNALKNPLISFAIFDSSQPAGTGNGVQGVGMIKLLQDKDMKEALKWYKSSFIAQVADKKGKLTYKYFGSYRLFKLASKKLFVLDPKEKIDKRVEVKL